MSLGISYMMSSVGRFVYGFATSAATRGTDRAVNTLSSGFKGGKAATSVTSSSVQTKFTIAKTVASYGWAAVVFLGALVFYVLRQFFLGFLPTLTQTVLSFASENKGLEYTERRDRWVVWVKQRFGSRISLPFIFIAELFEFTIQFVGIAIYAVFIKFPYNLLRCSVLIIPLIFLLAGLYIFTMHLPGIDAVFQDGTLMTMEVGNAGVAVANGAISAYQITLPLTNFATSTSIVLIAEIADGAQALVPSSNRRVLYEQSEGEKLLDTVSGVVISILWVIFQLIIVLIRIVVFILAPILPAILSALQLLAYKSACLLAGQHCAILEVLDVFVNAVIAPFTILFGGRIDIACGANQMPQVKCDCAGFLISTSNGVYRRLEPCGTADTRYFDPGFSEYENEAPARRVLLDTNDGGLVHRALVTCSKNADGEYVEQVGGALSTSISADSALACPIARRAFDPYTHAVDMQRLDTHSCILHCVAGVAMRSCDDGWNHTVAVMGTCGSERAEGAEAMDLGEARRRLAFLRVDTRALRAYFPPPRRAQTVEEPADADVLARVARLAATLPEIFVVEGVGTCDTRMAHVLSSFPALMDAIRCSLSYHVSLNPNWVRESVGIDPDAFAAYSPTLRTLQTAAEQATHDLRRARHAHAVNDVSSLYDSADTRPVNPVHAIAWERAQRKRTEQRARTNRRSLQGLVLPEEDPDAPLDATSAPSRSPTAFDDPNTEPADPDAAVPCLGRVLCPDQVTCATHRRFCPAPTTWGPFVWFAYRANQVRTALEDLDLRATLEEAVRCHRTRPFSRSPYNPRYLFKSYEERLKDRTVQWCFGEFAPSDYRLETASYSPGADVQTLCTGTEAFTGCNCPDFYPRTSALNVALNAGKFVLYVFALFAAAILSGFDAILESAELPNISSSAQSSSGLTNGEYSFCVLMHGYDFVATVLFGIVLYCALLSLEYIIEWALEWWNAAALVLCLRNPNSPAGQLAMQRAFPFEHFKAQFAFQYAKIYGSGDLTNLEIRIPFEPSQLGAAKRFEAWLRRYRPEEDVKSGMQGGVDSNKIGVAGIEEDRGVLFGGKHLKPLRWIRRRDLKKAATKDGKLEIVVDLRENI